MIDVEMWLVWCKGVVFGIVASVVIKEFGEWVRSRRTMRAEDVANAFCNCVEPHFNLVEKCSECGKPPRH